VSWCCRSNVWMCKKLFSSWGSYNILFSSLYLNIATWVTPQGHNTILAILDSKRKMQLEINALEYAIEEVLSQQQEDNSWRPIAYLSKTMNKMERNYKIYDWELLAIMKGLKQWWQYLIGSDQFKIWTDHKNLGYFKKLQKLNCHQAQ